MRPMKVKSSMQICKCANLQAARLIIWNWTRRRGLSVTRRFRWPVADQARTIKCSLSYAPSFPRQVGMNVQMPHRLICASVSTSHRSTAGCTVSYWAIWTRIPLECLAEARIQTDTPVSAARHVSTHPTFCNRPFARKDARRHGGLWERRYKSDNARSHLDRH